VILLDTHVLVWLLNGDQRLGTGSREVIDSAASQAAAHVSAITSWEIALLARKGRLALGRDPREWIDAALSLGGLVLAVVDLDIAIDAATLPGPFHADPADRFLVATSRRHGWSLLTADRAILGYGAAGHVQVVDAAV